MKKVKNNDFGDMSIDEIGKWEKETNSIVFFRSDGETSIAFQKITNAVVVLPNLKEDTVFILLNEQLKQLKEFLNS